MPGDCDWTLFRSSSQRDKHVTDFWKLTPAKVKSLKLEVKLPEEKTNVDWPNKKALAKLIQQKPVSHIAADLGLSDQAVRKHCEKLDLELPSRGFWQKKRAGVLGKDLQE